MRHSFCAASFRNTSPRCRRSSPYSVFLRHFGMKTTWYLHSHFVWLRLSSSSIDEVSFRVLGGSRSEASSMDPLKCQTSTATPAEPGGLSLTLASPLLPSRRAATFPFKFKSTLSLVHPRTSVPRDS